MKRLWVCAVLVTGIVAAIFLRFPIGADATVREPASVGEQEDLLYSGGPEMHLPAQGEAAAGDISLCEQEQGESPPAESLPEELPATDWAHDAANSAGMWHQADYRATASGEDALLAQWVHAFRSGAGAQIYIDGPGEGMFHTWRLTCEGGAQYRIENRGAGDDMPVLTSLSADLLEGSIYYVFGRDVQEEFEYLPLTVFKGNPVGWKPAALPHFGGRFAGQPPPNRTDTFRCIRLSGRF